MSDFLVQLAELIKRIVDGNPGKQRFCVLGADYERREARRSALWILAILTVLLLIGWGLLQWIRYS